MAAESWPCEWPDKAVNERATSAAVEGPGLKLSVRRTFEAGHHEESLLVKVWPSCS